MKIALFWYATPCNLEDIYQRFGGTSSFHFQTLKVETGGSSKTLVSDRLHGVTVYRRIIFITYRKQYMAWSAISSFPTLNFRGDLVVI
jgi:hypothetical protein